MNINLEYFGMGILGMGKWISRAQFLGYVGRVALMSIGLMVFVFGLSMNFDIHKMFEVTHLFTGKVMDAGASAPTRVLMVFLGFFAICFIAFFIMGWKKFKKTVNGDEVAMDLFEDINTTVIEKDVA